MEYILLLLQTVTGRICFNLFFLYVSFPTRTHIHTISSGSSNSNGLNHSPNGRQQPQSYTPASMNVPSPVGQQQHQHQSVSSVMPPSGLLIGSSRRESREAETQFMSIDTSSILQAGGSNAPSGHVSNGSNGNDLLHPLHPHSLEHGLTNYSVGSERQLNLAIGAVLLDEWLRELSAVTQEQCIMMLSEQVQQHQQQPPARTAS